MVTYPPIEGTRKLHWFDPLHMVCSTPLGCMPSLSIPMWGLQPCPGRRQTPWLWSLPQNMAWACIMNICSNMTRWWQLKYVFCSLISLGEMMPDFDEQIFSIGCFNHLTSWSLCSSDFFQGFHVIKEASRKLSDKLTLLETNSSPLNIDPWKRRFLLENHHFLGANGLTVSFRKCMSPIKQHEGKSPKKTTNFQPPSVTGTGWLLGLSNRSSVFFLGWNQLVVLW